MSIDEPHVALPTLYGAPAYTRPPGTKAVDRPFDPDELPIEAEMTEEEREFTATLPARAYAPGGVDLAADRTSSGSNGKLSGRSFSIRSITGRLLRS